MHLDRVRSGARRQKIQNTLHLCTQMLHASKKGYTHLSLPKLLHIFRAAQSTDVRDKIYGLLGLSSEFKGGASLEVDYAQGPEHLFFKVMSLCNSEDSLRLAQLLLNVLDLRDSSSSLLSTVKSCGTKLSAMQNLRPRVQLIYIGKLKKIKPVGLKYLFRDIDHMEDYGTFTIRRQNSHRKLCIEDHDPGYYWLTLLQYQSRAGDRLYWFAGTKFALIYRKTRTGSMFFHDQEQSLVGTAFTHGHSRDTIAQDCLMLKGSLSLCHSLHEDGQVLDKRSTSTWVQLGNEKFAQLLNKSNHERLLLEPGAIDPADLGTRYEKLSKVIGILVDMEARFSTPIIRNKYLPELHQRLTRKIKL